MEKRLKERECFEKAVDQSEDRRGKKSRKKANPNLQFDALIVADDRFHLKVDANCGHERRGKAALKAE